MLRLRAALARSLGRPRALSTLRAPAHDAPSADALREDLALAYRAAARLGMNEGVCNHFTAALAPRDDASFLVIAHGTPWEACGASDLLEVDAAGRVVASTRRATSNFESLFCFLVRRHMANHS